MTAREEREYRNVSKKLAGVEERSKLLDELKKRKICLAEEEEFVLKETKKLKTLGNSKGLVKKQHEEIVSVSLKYKIKDNNHLGVKLRRRKNWLRGRLEQTLGIKSIEYRDIMMSVREYIVGYKKRLRDKNRRKVEHLTKKYGMKRSNQLRWGDVNDEMKRMMGTPRMFMDDCVMKGETVVDPVIVEGENEQIVLSENERELLKLGPKFCTFNRLVDEDFETDLEECIMKVKWDMMGDGEEKERGSEEKAFEILLGKKECVKIDEEAQEERDIIEAEKRSIYDWKTRTLSYSRRRATDVKGNSRVIFPSKARSLEEESALQTLRLELSTVFRGYAEEHCDKEGKQELNLTKSQRDGLKSLKKRMKDGELVVIPTDKSGNLAVMSQDTYRRAGMKHTVEDMEVTWDQIKESQRELNGHVSMVIKIFKIGSFWKHELRIRESMIGEGQSICPLSLLLRTC